MGEGLRMSALAVIGALALGAVVTGCGPESHANDPRPPLAPEVTINITEDAVQLQPDTVGVGNGSTQINQNRGVEEPQADPDEPLVVHFTAANTTLVDTRLELSGQEDEQSEVIVGGGTGEFKLALPTGDYQVTAENLPRSEPAGFAVGSDRTSSQNELLLP